MVFDKKTLRNIFLVACGCIVLYWILHETDQFNAAFGTLKSIFSPFVLGAGFAFIMNVPMRAIEKKLLGIKKQALRRTVSILLTIVLFLLILAVVFWLLIPQLTETAKTFVSKLPGFFAKVQAVVAQFLYDNPDLLQWIDENIIQAFDPQKLSSLLESALDQVGNSISTIVSGTVSAISVVVDVLYDAIVSIVFAIYCLAQKETLARQCKRILYSLLPEKWSDNIVRVMRLTNTTFSNFLSGQFIEVCILGSMFAISMAIFRMPYIPLVSVLVAVTAFIPLVGAFIGCFFGALFILVDNPMQAVWFVVMFLALQQIEGNLIYPRVVGSRTGLPGMWVLVAVSVGGELMGISGMFLMVPMASVLYTLLGELTRNRLAAKGIPAEKLANPPVEKRNKKPRIKTKGKKTEDAPADEAASS